MLYENISSDFEDKLFEIKEACIINANIILDTSPNYDDNEISPINCDMGLDVLREKIAEILGTIAKYLFHENPDSTFLITGGDTLISFMKSLEVTEMCPIEEILPGVVAAEFIHAGVCHQILTKSGGFGEKNLLPRLSEIINRGKV